MRRVPIVRARYFFWIVIPIVACAILATLGTPHVIWSYEWPGDRYLEADERYYSSCTYVGFSGVARQTATNGQCPWIRFIKSDGA